MNHNFFLFKEPKSLLQNASDMLRWRVFPFHSVGNLPTVIANQQLHSFLALLRMVLNEPGEERQQVKPLSTGRQFGCSNFVGASTRRPVRASGRGQERKKAQRGKGANKKVTGPGRPACRWIYGVHARARSLCALSVNWYLDGSISTLAPGMRSFPYEYLPSQSLGRLAGCRKIMIIRLTERERENARGQI